MGTRDYAEQLREGGELVAVSVSNREEAVAAADVLRGLGLDRVRYYGGAVVETL